MTCINCLIDLVVKASTLRAVDPGFAFCLDFSSHLKTGNPVATLTGAWHYIGSALGMIDPVSVYCDGMRLKV